MIRYTVVWHLRAEDQLAEIWLNAKDKANVSAASNAIESEVAIDPDLKGFEVVANVRVLVITPLAAVFEIFADDRLVRIAKISRVKIGS